MNASTLYLSPSKVATYEMCPRMYQYQYELRWKPLAESATLLYGTAMHTALEQHLFAQVKGGYVSPKDAFVEAWRNNIRDVSVKYTDKWDALSLEACGTRSANLFEARWTEQGYQVCVDPKGVPLLETSLLLDLGDGVIFRLKLDVVFTTPAGLVNVGDFKTPRNPGPENFAYVADQTLAYQVAVESHGEALGIDRVDEVRFIEIYKAKRDNKISFDCVAPRRPDDQVEEYLDKVRHIAAAIRAKQFPRKAGMSFNSPCQMCDFAAHCARNELGDIDPESVQKSLSIVAKASYQQKAVPTLVRVA